ncbi:MAG TPA: hypothetical protein VKZ53_06840 [Candidatus Angelobacter sp.]|nr:hypothetical protein [Candidatus Angelobacter sp.]
MSGYPQQTDPSNLKQRLLAITNELESLHEEFYWMVLPEHAGSAPPQLVNELSVAQIANLKLALDNMRDFLWKYMDAAVRADSSKAQEVTDIDQLRRSTQFLRLLREGLTTQTPGQPVSFIERISAEVEERLQTGPQQAA